MAPKLDCVYSRRHFKSVALSKQMVIGSDDERYLEYVLQGTLTPTCAARTYRATPPKVAPGGFTASQSEEERILTSTPSRYAAHSEGVFSSKEASGSEEAFGSMEAFKFEEYSAFLNANALDTLVHSASSDEAYSADYTPVPQIYVPNLVSYQPNRWFLEGQYQAYTDAKVATTRGSLPIP